MATSVQGLRTSGTVKFFNSQKGYGFIIPETNMEEGLEVFVHHTAILKPDGGFRSLAEGESVEFDLIHGPKGLQSANVSGPNGAPVKGDPNAQQGGANASSGASGTPRVYTQSYAPYYNNKEQGPNQALTPPPTYAIPANFFVPATHQWPGGYQTAVAYTPYGAVPMPSSASVGNMIQGGVPQQAPPLTPSSSTTPSPSSASTAGGPVNAGATSGFGHGHQHQQHHQTHPVNSVQGSYAMYTNGIGMVAPVVAPAAAPDSLEASGNQSQTQQGGQQQLIYNTATGQAYYAQVPHYYTATAAAGGSTYSQGGRGPQR
ncbi:Y box binding protein 1 [Blyttiomyces sp. JEL0837]|nr:Y box binding protein 1 [Blyttiomyces sp. JEL0837]